MNAANRNAWLRDRFEGCLLGLAVGDALGGKFEAQSADAIRARFPSVESLIAYPQDEIWYTDDTQMAIGVAEALIERGHQFRGGLVLHFPQRSDDRSGPRIEKRTRQPQPLITAPTFCNSARTSRKRYKPGIQV